MENSQRGAKPRRHLADFYARHRKICTDRGSAMHKTNARSKTGMSDMLSIICGLALIAGSAGGFWFLLPRKGQEHPFVENTGVGSTVAIAIISSLSIGVALLFNGFAG